ncbi:hypothetical protein N9N67_04485 [Bacteriovoracaceae bacterium]|nr:hypothetical protein [Bacteriovoracaceae bacterium]
MNNIFIFLIGLISINLYSQDKLKDYEISHLSDSKKFLHEINVKTHEVVLVASQKHAKYRSEMSKSSIYIEKIEDCFINDQSITEAVTLLDVFLLNQEIYYIPEITSPLVRYEDYDTQKKLLLGANKIKDIIDNYCSEFSSDDGESYYVFKCHTKLDENLPGMSEELEQYDKLLGLWSKKIEEFDHIKNEFEGLLRRVVIVSKAYKVISEDAPKCAVSFDF